MTKSEILEKISEEDIYRKYLGHSILKKMFKSPLRKESTPSFGLYKNDKGRILWKDFGLGGGDCFELVEKMFNIDFNKALQLITSDFNLSFNSFRPKVKQSLYTLQNKVTEKKHVVFKYEEKNFSVKELKYWEQYGISYDILKEYNVSPVKWVRQEEKTGFIGIDDNPIFMYKYPSGNVRFYRPMAFNGIMKHFGNSTGTDIFGYEQLYSNCGENRSVVLCAGQKDALSIFANTGRRTVSLNSESCTLTKEIFEKLKNCADDIRIAYDMDKTGRLYSDKICKEYGLYDMMQEYALSEGEKDVSDYYQRILNKKLQTIK